MESDPESGTPLRHDGPTVIAAAVIAYVLAKVTHEGIGHAGACLAVGAELRGWSSSWCDCEGDAQWSLRAVKAAGTLANLGLGLVLTRLTPRLTTPALRYTAAFAASTQVAMGFGYLLTDPIFGFGDWTAFVEGLPQPLVLRGLLVATGAAGFAWTIGWTRRWLAHFGADGRTLTHGKVLLLLPYLLIGGLFLTGTALSNRLGPVFALTSAMATLGGTSLFAWCWTWPLDEPGPDYGHRIDRSRPLIVAAGLVAALQILLFGPGL